MYSKLSRFTALPPADKWLLVQAWFMLGLMRAATVAVPLKKLTAAMQHHHGETPVVIVSRQQQREAVRVGRLVEIAARFTPWQSLCLAQVFVTQRLLSRRNIPGQFFLGVRRGNDPTGVAADLAAHAWLQCGAHIVNGAAGHGQFTVVSTFSWGARRD